MRIPAELPATEAWEVLLAFLLSVPGQMLAAGAVCLALGWLIERRKGALGQDRRG
jgi:hypothetical protein